MLNVKLIQLIILALSLILMNCSQDSKDEQPLEHQVSQKPESDASTAINKDDDTESSFLEEIEMGSLHKKDNMPRPRATPDDETVKQFRKEFHSAGRKRKEVYEKYLPIVGIEWILDFLETTYPQCHSIAHELGHAYYARVKDIGEAIRACKKGCTSGCMHGVLMGAFGGKTLQDVQEQMVSFCRDDEMLQIHKPGNCAHGIGHALMVVSDYNIEKSLEGCSSFPDPAMGYYCATGVFMEKLVTGKKKEWFPRSRHYPCDAHTQYPAACYRYKVPRILRSFNGDRKRMVNECLELPRALRLGCFHGLGAAYISRITVKPDFISEVCTHGTREDQILCIEGAIEKAAEYNEEKAMAACASLDGEIADICTAAANEKMYRLKKPSMELYYGQ